VVNNSTNINKTNKYTLHGF